ncbi:DUF6131 family protein [Mycolicibacterium llatzerense]|uniref:DUF6131 family protein n=1 Tax=Mycolicibacterium llatzerense TaxID=280871 RepID=UPI000A484165|nr:DUF6131 family protein [Mycolicibacterium llatzerense]
MIVVGIVLIIAGLLLNTNLPLVPIGIVLLVIGLVLMAMGRMGRPAFGRRHYY